MSQGGYDDLIRLWDKRNWKKPLSEVHLRGGVWRTRFNQSGCVWKHPNKVKSRRSVKMTLPFDSKRQFNFILFGFQVWSLILHLKSLDLFGSSTAIYRPLCPWLCFLRILKRYERWSDFGTMYVRKCYNNKCQRKWIKRRMEIESSWKYNVRWMLARRPEMFRDVIILW